MELISIKRGYDFATVSNALFLNDGLLKKEVPRRTLKRCLFFLHLVEVLRRLLNWLIILHCTILTPVFVFGTCEPRKTFACCIMFISPYDSDSVAMLQ